MPRRLKRVPVFTSERAEREFWLTHDSADYVDWTRARRTIFPNLRPSSRTISIRVSEILLAEVKSLARRRGIPYQSLMKIMLDEGTRRALKSA